jgi:hypothetical protein
MVISLSACELDFRNFNIFTKQSGNNKNNQYLGYFKEIADEIKDDREAGKVLKSLQDEFSRKFNEKISTINSLKQNTASDESIEASAFSSLTTNEAETGAFGDNNDFDSNDKKAIICGARGKIINLEGVQEIKMVTVGEIVEFDTGSLLVGYTTFRQDGTFDLSIKVNDNYRTKNFNSKGEFINAKIISRKLILNKKKMSIGTSNIYILTIGKDFIKYTIYNLVIGASIKNKEALSRSIVNIRVFTVDSSLKVETVEAVFISSNVCHFDKDCISSHNGYMKVDAENLQSQQMTGSAAISSIKKNMNASVANYHASVKKKN